MFGGLAVLLASIGLFGLMSYSVARRTNEIGIRMALGARRQDVLRLVMRESMMLVVAGIAIGLAIAARLEPFNRQPAVRPVADRRDDHRRGRSHVLVIVSAVAGYLPARRAARVDPLVALHYE